MWWANVVLIYCNKNPSQHSVWMSEDLPLEDILLRMSRFIMLSINRVFVTGLEITFNSDCTFMYKYNVFYDLSWQVWYLNSDLFGGSKPFCINNNILRFEWQSTGISDEQQNFKC